MINLAGDTAQYRLRDGLNDTAYVCEWQDLLDNGLYVRLEGHGAHIFNLDAA